MAKVSKAVQAACRVIRRGVRFRTACLRLPGTEWEGNDAPAIRKASKLYVETWVVPLLNAIETGDTRTLQRMCYGKDGDKIDDEPDPEVVD